MNKRVGIFSIESLQTTYKNQVKDADEKNPEYDNGENKSVFILEPIKKEVESIEEKMAKFYEEKEEKANKNYRKALYENPPPPSDREIERRKNFWKTSGSRMEWR